MFAGVVLLKRFIFGFCPAVASSNITKLKWLEGEEKTCFRDLGRLVIIENVNFVH